MPCLVDLRRLTLRLGRVWLVRGIGGKFGEHSLRLSHRPFGNRIAIRASDTCRDLVIEKLVRNRALYILRKKKYYAYNYIRFIFEFVYKDDMLMWEALIWKRVAID